jgi:phosphatidylserine/phosphatidylglycerophosphate/cardiolipin synthase-like enzyme
MESIEVRQRLVEALLPDLVSPFPGSPLESETLLQTPSREWPGRWLPACYCDPRALALAPDARDRACLHAKCIVVDHSTALVSSANFAEDMPERNIEARVLVHSMFFADHLERHSERMVQSAAMQQAG